ncbi:MAG: hypothetical protein U5L45_24690 [Saprospiraceae bacterium]|nr:hypothetical protein [Saprospiraceae bacterium]
MLASLAKKGKGVRFSGKARKTNPLSFFCERSEQKCTKYHHQIIMINLALLREMIENNYVNVNKHPTHDLFIYNYTAKTQYDRIWNEITLSFTNETRVRQLVQEFNKKHNDTVQVEVKEMDVSLQECIARDAKRPKPVGAKHIRAMHRQFYALKTAIEQDTTLPKGIICDLDGTLALMNGRNPYDAARCEEDLLNAPVAKVLKTFQALGYKVLLLSGRKEEHKPQTINWLATHAITYDLLELRKTGDNRADTLVKKDLFNAFVSGKYYVEFILDDRDQVVDLWRNDLGLTCFQVNYGDF